MPASLILRGMLPLADAAGVGRNKLQACLTKFLESLTTCSVVEEEWRNEKGREELETPHKIDLGDFDLGTLARNCDVKL